LFEWLQNIIDKSQKVYQSFQNISGIKNCKKSKGYKDKYANQAEKERLI